MSRNNGQHGLVDKPHTHRTQHAHYTSRTPRTSANKLRVLMTNPHALARGSEKS